MSSWTDAHVVYLGHNRWRLLNATTYDIGRLGSGVSVSVPSGFVCDLASVPRAWQWLVRHGPLAQAAVLHDWLLSEGWSRFVAASIFREAARASGVGPVQALLAYFGVRLWDAWRASSAVVT